MVERETFPMRIEMKPIILKKMTPHNIKTRVNGGLRLELKEGVLCLENNKSTNETPNKTFVPVSFRTFLIQRIILGRKEDRVCRRKI